ncbi:MAG: hypothetical protein ACFB0B_16435, partial [Thermonemataceae bacterium]
MITKKLLLLLVAMLVVSFLRAQYQFSNSENVNYTQPSPEAATLIKGVNKDVDLYTGTLQVDIPLYTLNTKSFTIPVGLSYTATGLKVQEIGGLAGEGFSVKGGGAITRIVRGLPDEAETGYCHPSGIGYKMSSTLTVEEADQVLRGEMDGEPDLFYFNVPGASGKFVLDHTGKPVLMPYQDITIQPGIGPKSGNNNQWVIKMPNGNSYTFGVYEGATDVDRTSTKYPFKSEPVEFVSTWHLKRIHSAITDDEVIFYYTEAQPTTFTQYHQDISDVVENIEQNCFHNNIPTTTGIRDLNTVITTESELLSQIVTNHIRINFEYFSGRLDYENKVGYALDRIIVEYIPTHFIHIYNFSYEYTAAPRLLLKYIYQEDGTGKNGLNLYEFTYNPIHLPARSSKQIDYWGYHNTNPEGVLVPSVTRWTDSLIEGGGYLYFSGGTRTSDAVKMQADLLTRVTYTTGGSKTFTYEPHTYWDGSTNKMVGGVRIKTIAERDDQSEANTLITRYTYNTPSTTRSSGQLDYEPEGTLKEFFRTLHVLPSQQANVCARLYMRRLSDIKRNILQDTHIGYSYVTVEKQGLGKIQHQFTNLKDHGDQPAENYKVYSVSEPSADTDKDNSYFTTSHFWERGLLLEKKVLDQQGRLREEYTYDYDFNRPEKARVACVETTSLQYYTSIPNSLQIDVAKVFHISKPLLKTSEQTKLYEADGSYISVSKTFTYGHSNYLVPTRITEVNSKGEEFQTEHRYSFHYSEKSSVVGAMELFGITHIPIETVTQKKINGAWYTLDASLTEYKEAFMNQTGIFLPQGQYRLRTSRPLDIFQASVQDGRWKVRDSHYKKEYSITYDADFNPKEMIYEDGRAEAILWGYDTQPVAVVKGSRYVDMAYTSFEEGDCDNWIGDPAYIKPTTNNKTG